MKTIHHYNAETGEYLGPGQADESPLEPGVFLIPAHATEAAPPAEVAGKVRVLEAGAWVQRDIPPPPVEPPPPEPTSEQIAAEQKAREVAIAMDALPALLAYVAAKPDSPAEVKAQAAELTAERAKVK